MCFFKILHSFSYVSYVRVCELILHLDEYEDTNHYDDPHERIHLFDRTNRIENVERDLILLFRTILSTGIRF